MTLVRQVRPMAVAGPDGTFGTPFVPAGDYLVLVLRLRDFEDQVDVPPAGLFDRLAQRIVLRANEGRWIDLRVRVLDEDRNRREDLAAIARPRSGW